MNLLDLLLKTETDLRAQLPPAPGKRAGDAVRRARDVVLAVRDRPGFDPRDDAHQDAYDAALAVVGRALLVLSAPDADVRDARIASLGDDAEFVEMEAEGEPDEPEADDEAVLRLAEA